MDSKQKQRSPNELLMKEECQVARRLQNVYRDETLLKGAMYYHWWLLSTVPSFVNMWMSDSLNPSLVSMSSWQYWFCLESFIHQQCKIWTTNGKLCALLHDFWYSPCIFFQSWMVCRLKNITSVFSHCWWILSPTFSVNSMYQIHFSISTFPVCSPLLYFIALKRAVSGPWKVFFYLINGKNLHLGE